MPRLIAPGIVLVVVLGSGALAGLWSGRWGSSQAVQAAAARLQGLPLSLGDDWDVQAKELDARMVEIAEMEGYVSRQYRHRRKGTVISVLLFCGRSGPLCVHTPEICFAGAGYVPLGPAKIHEGPGQFRVQDFRKENVAAPTLLRIFLSWGDKGEWSVPDNPRLAFAHRPSLYKLYVVREMSKANEPIEQDPVSELLEDLIPQLNKECFAVPGV